MFQGKNIFPPNLINHVDVPALHRQHRLADCPEEVHGAGGDSGQDRVGGGEYGGAGLSDYKKNILPNTTM